MRFKTVNSIPAGTTAAVTFNGPAVPIGNMTAISAQVTVAGGTSIVGVSKIQVSDDAPLDGTERGFVPANWSDLPSATIPVSGNAPFLTPVVSVCARWARHVYTFTSGSGGTIIGNLHTQGYGQG